MPTHWPAAVIVAVGVTATTAHGAIGGQPAGDPSARTTAVAAARAFLDTLDEDATRLVQFPFDSAERRRWGRGPAVRPGIACGDMTAEQSALLVRLLDTVLSADGMAAVDSVRREQDILGEDEEGLGRGYYWFAIYGAPGDGRWSWRLGGHHLSLHATYRGDAVASVTPIHLGGEIAGDADRDWSAYRALLPRKDRARLFVDSMTKDQWLPAHADAVAPGSLLMSEPQVAPLTRSRDGLSLSDINGIQRAMVDALVDEYLRLFDPPVAAVLRARYEHVRPKARFRWRGTKNPGDAHYYCILGDGFLIESLDVGTHVHTILRTDADWGEQPATPETGQSP